MIGYQPVIPLLLPRKLQSAMKNLRKPSPPQSPLRFIILLCVAIFLGELVSMYLVSFLRPLPPILEAVIDALLLLVLSLPILYFLEFRPLRRTIQERERAEASLRSARDLLEQRNRESKLLAEMSGYLQACNTSDEAYLVIAHSAQGLFVDSNGGLFVYNASRNDLKVQSTWGRLELNDNDCIFPPDECWALRRSKLFQTDDEHIGAPCRHLPEGRGGQTMCVPMIAHGEALGVIYIHRDQAHQNPESRDSDLELERALAVALAEQAGLALANLELRESLRNQSIRDPLTGLFNRRYLEETLERELQRAKRSGTRLAVVMCDLDHFKCFNDEYGHDAGDYLLRELGNMLRQEFRGSDIPCRYGGEELTLILPDIEVECAVNRMESLRQNIENLPVVYHDRMLGTVTISGGISMYPMNGGTPEALIKAADEALYVAKNAGRNQFVLAAPD